MNSENMNSEDSNNPMDMRKQKQMGTESLSMELSIKMIMNHLII